MNWVLAKEIAVSLILLVAGGFISRWFEKRSRLIAYYGHVSAFRANPPGQPAVDVNTHSIVIKNSGNSSATNVRIHHRRLPHYSIFPSILHNVETLSDGSQDIVVPILVAKEEITISYLYFPPVTFKDINYGIKSDQGLAKEITVLLQPVYSKSFTRFVVATFLIGFATLAYGVITAIILGARILEKHGVIPN